MHCCRQFGCGSGSRFSGSATSGNKTITAAKNFTPSFRTELKFLELAMAEVLKNVAQQQASHGQQKEMLCWKSHCLWEAVVNATLALIWWTPFSKRRAVQSSVSSLNFFHSNFGFLVHQNRKRVRCMWCQPRKGTLFRMLQAKTASSAPERPHLH